MNTLSKTTLAVALVALGGCVSMPAGPSVMVLPGTGKSFDQFRADDYICRQFASEQIGGATAAQQAAENAGVNSALLGTALGAVAGAAANGSHGAAVGAGAGMVMGSIAGTGAAQTSGYGMQQRYDYAYLQCMYAKGNRVPVSGRFSTYTETTPATPPPPPPPSAPGAGGITPPPPPAGTPPPPPPPGSAPAAR